MRPLLDYSLPEVIEYPDSLFPWQDKELINSLQTESLCREELDTTLEVVEATSLPWSLEGPIE